MDISVAVVCRFAVDAVDYVEVLTRNRHIVGHRSTENLRGLFFVLSNIRLLHLDLYRLYTRVMTRECTYNKSMYPRTYVKSACPFNFTRNRCDQYWRMSSRRDL